MLFLGEDCNGLWKAFPVSAGYWKKTACLPSFTVPPTPPCGEEATLLSGRIVPPRAGCWVATCSAPLSHFIPGSSWRSASLYYTSPPVQLSSFSQHLIWPFTFRHFSSKLYLITRTVETISTTFSDYIECSVKGHKPKSSSLYHACVTNVFYYSLLSAISGCSVTIVCFNGMTDSKFTKICTLMTTKGPLLHYCLCFMVSIGIL